MSVSIESGERMRKAIEIAAQCWCKPNTSKTVMDPELAGVFAKALESYAAEARKEALKEAAKAIKNIKTEKGDDCYACDCCGEVPQERFSDCILALAERKDNAIHE